MTTEGNLRPLTLPSLSPSLRRLKELKLSLTQLELDLERLSKLDLKLETFTDEPLYDAFIPFGSLAFFKGQLVHTNDITVTTTSQPSSTDQVSAITTPSKGEERGSSVLRSAKQAKVESKRLQQETRTRIETLEKQISQAERDLKDERERERREGKGKATTGSSSSSSGAEAISLGGLGEEEDWSVNERGEVINEDGLPIFDIREDLPLEEPIPSPSSSDSTKSRTSGGSEKKPLRYLVKKGGKQIVRPIATPSSSTTTNPVPTTSSASSASTPSSSLPTSTSTSASTLTPTSTTANDATTATTPTLDVRAILDELEAEEERERELEEAKEKREESNDTLSSDEKKVLEEKKEKEETSVKVNNLVVREGEGKGEGEKPFAGFSKGFLSKSKQKRPSNSLVSNITSKPAIPTSSSITTSIATPSSPSNPSSSTTSTTNTAPLPLNPVLKSSLSRSNSRSASPAPKSVVFDLPVPDDQVPTRENADQKSKKSKTPIILGMGPMGDDCVMGGKVEEAKERRPPVVEMNEDRKEKKKKDEFVRPIKDLVVEKPLKKVLPPGGTGGGGTMDGGGGKKKVSRFRQMKDQTVEGGGTKSTIEDKGKGKEKVIDVGQVTSRPSVPISPSDPDSATPSSTSIPAPVHTISLSSKPSPSSSTSKPHNPTGTISYADIPFGSDEEEEEEEEDPTLSSDDDDLLYPDEEDSEDFDEEDFDVDAALHQREVALEYHRQRLGVGAGRGTGPLGGFHSGDQSPFGQAVAQQGLVPIDATLDSLSSPLTHSAALGKSSRFRTSNKHLESASLIIPSILANDASVKNSHTMLGPASTSEKGGGVEREEGDLEREEEERMRRTLEALVEGRPLPEDEQRIERDREIRLREEYAKSHSSRGGGEDDDDEQRRRTAGKAPPMISSTLPTTRPVREAVKINVPENTVVGERRSKEEQDEEERREVEREEEKRRERETIIQSTGEGVKPKMSRFRQKQLGLLD